MAMAADSGSPYVRVAALACRGVSHLISQRFEAPVDDLEKALAYARSRKAGLEGEAKMLADLANAYQLNGDLRRASRTAVEAIEVATARAARVPECLARIVHAEVLCQAGETERAGLELGKVRALMQEIGARLYEPLIRDLSARIERNTGGVRPETQRARVGNEGNCA